jgi:hypothetical protein
MKKIIVALTVVGLLFVPGFAVQAQTNGESVYISLGVQHPDPVYVDANDYIVLGHGWGACTRGFIQAYLSAVHTEVTINGELVSAADGKDQHWGPITKAPDAYWVSSCIAGNQNTSSVVNWRYPLGTLTPGEHVVHFRYWFDHPILDGGDWDGDGHLDRWGGTFLDRTFTIIVLE